MASKNVVVIRSMNAYNHATKPFGPADIVCVIRDARDLGVQLYANQPGSIYFTLPVDHPSLPLINPLSQHYSVEKWDGSAYVVIQAGIITDYDAGESEVVISGVDYLAALNKYYTPIPGPKLGEKAVPDTNETSLDASHYDTSKYSANIGSFGNTLWGRSYGAKERDFPNSFSAIQQDGNDTYTSAATQVQPNTSGVTSSSKPVITPKAIIANAVNFDKELHYFGTQGQSFDSVDSENGDIRIWPGVPQSGTTPTGKENEIYVDYVVDANGNKTGDVKISGSIFIFRGPSSSSSPRYSFVDNGTGAEIEMDFSVENVGIVIYASPGGPLYVMHLGSNIGSGSTDIGTSSNSPMNFNLTLRPISKYDPATEQCHGLNRTVSILTEGVSYSFAARPYYIGFLSTPSTSLPSYYQYIYGDITRYSGTAATAGLKSNSVSNIFSSTFTDVMDRSRDYPNLVLSVATGSRSGTTASLVLSVGAPGMLSSGDSVSVTDVSNAALNGTFTLTNISSDRKTIQYTTGTSGTITGATGGIVTKTYAALTPIVKFTSLNQINTGSSVYKHPYATSGQGPVDFFTEIAELEMGSRVDGSKIVYNFFGVPGATPTGDTLIVNHNVSSTSQATLVYPGQISGFNVASKRSSRVNSVRVIPTTEFLIGASTEGASNGVKSQGVVRMPTYAVSDPALPVVITQGGFISPEGASNAGQGTVNDFGTNDDVTAIKVQLRTEVFGPIGMTGTPKLGETVTVVIRRKSSSVASDEVVQTYNVGGMEWTARIDGTESLYLDLVKPNKFVGPAISWESKPAPSAEKTNFVADSEKEPKKKKKKPPTLPPKTSINDYTDPVLAADGKTWLPAPADHAARFLTGTSYMWAGIVGGGKKPKKPKKPVGLPRVGPPRRDGGRGGT